MCKFCSYSNTPQQNSCSLTIHPAVNSGTMGRDHYNIRALLCAYDPGSFCFLKAKTVTIVTIKIGAGLLSLAYLMSDDEKLFAAVSQQIFFLFLQISLLTKCAYPFRAIPLLPTSVGAASIALWHPPALCGQQPCTNAGEPAPLILSAKGENSWRENRQSE